MQRRLVIFDSQRCGGDPPLQDGDPQSGSADERRTTQLVLRPTPQQRSEAALPVAEIRFIDVDDAASANPEPAVPGQPRSAAVYRAVTPRLTRDEEGTRAGTADSVAGVPRPLRRYWFLSFVNGLPGHEHDYDRWYLKHHLHEVLRAPDFVAAQRFTLERSLQHELLPPFRFMAVYELRSNDLARSIAALNALVASGSMTETPFKDPSRRLQLFAEAMQIDDIGGRP
ncbi:MAG: hypothetical protein AB7L76_11305 [Burkholderiaceae bacterium]